MRRKVNNGFTLIELMIVIAIIGILFAIAIPAYQRHVVKSRRVDVQRLLVENAQTMERYFSANNTYLDTAGTACAVTITDTTYYTFGTSTCTATTFTFTAVPVSTSSQNGDGNQSLDQTGARTGTWSS